ncbi:hypothetical protein HDU96_007896 [Phlyctochytrium bullatum]|nr:hypothetical protein HDU96_007896 [Phlyctochytrium bullatum]
MLFHPEIVSTPHDRLNVSSPGSAHLSPNPHLMPSPMVGSLLNALLAGFMGSHPQTQPSSGEEITTIFVVGFPEDMQEREFQNMFMFCPGFEAATLKLPSLGEDSENVPLYKKQIIGFVKFRTRLEALQARDVLNGRKVDAERGCILKAEIAKKNLHTKRGLSNDHTSHGTPNFPMMSRLNVPAGLMGAVSSGPLSAGVAVRPTVLPSPKDAPMGFADPFYLQSPIPRDLMAASALFTPSLQSQSSQNGSTLSQTSSTHPHTPGSHGLPHHSQLHSSQHSLLLSQQHSSQQTQQPGQQQQQQSQSTFDYFSGALAAAAAAAAERSLQTSRRGSPTSSVDATTVTTATLSDTSNRSSGASSLSGANDASDFRSGTLLNESSSGKFAFSGLSGLSGSANANGTSEIGLTTPGSTSLSTGRSGTTGANSVRGLDSPRFGASFLESLMDPPPPPPSVMASVASRSQSERGFSSALYSSESLLTSRLPPALTINTNLSNVLGGGGLNSPTSATMPSPSTPFATLPPGPASAGPVGPGYRSLADQNPPCNTLYVGNLPNNASEDELRMLFSRCVGYRRLCFRQRPNGPMCFVEFDDVSCAHQALLELHGNPLTNSIKGGIRLSFSKNPLGVRQQQPSQTVQQQQAQHLQMQLHLQQQQQQQQQQHHHAQQLQQGVPGSVMASVAQHQQLAAASNSSSSSSSSSASSSPSPPASSSSGASSVASGHGAGMEKDTGRLIYSC